MRGEPPFAVQRLFRRAASNTCAGFDNVSSERVAISVLRCAQASVNASATIEAAHLHGHMQCARGFVLQQLQQRATAFESNDRMTRQLVEAHALAVRQLEILVHDRAQPVRAVRKDLQGRGRLPFGEQSEVESSIAHALEDRVARQLAQVHADVGMLLEEAREVFGNELRHRRRIRPESHRTEPADAIFVELLLQALKVEQQLASLGNDGTSRIGRRDAFSVSLEQLDL
jgi:hypothetical protein